MSVKETGAGRPDGTRRPPAIGTLREMPAGFPLSYFAGTEPFRRWLRLADPPAPPRTVPDWGQRPIKPDRPAPRPWRPPEWTEHVWLERFATRVIAKGPLKDCHEHVVELSTRRPIPVLLPQPKATVAIFGATRKADEAPDRLRLRFIRAPKQGRLIGVDISGALRFRLPRALVRPVVDRDGRWVDADASHVVVPLGGSMIRLRNGLAPRLSAPLHAPPLTVRLGETGMVAKLAAARVDLAGSAAAPRIRFRKIRLVLLPA